MKTIKTQNNIELIVVEVPEDAYDFKVEVDFLIYRDNKTSIWNEGTPINIPEGNYKILGKLSELSEEECKRFVEFKEIQILDWKTGHNGFKDYKKSNNENNYFTLGLPKESFISLLQSQEVNTSNPNTLLIIEKI